MDFEDLEEAEVQSQCGVPRIELEVRQFSTLFQQPEQHVLAYLANTISNVRACDQKHWTLMHFAAARPQHIGGSAALAQRLQELRAAVDAQNNLGQTPLFLASREGNLECARFLLNSGCRADHTDNAGQTALFYAAREGHVDIVTLLHHFRARICTIDALKQSALFYAAREGHTKCCQELVKLSCKVAHMDIHGNTAMFYAKRFGHKDTIAQLAYLMQIDATLPNHARTNASKCPAAERAPRQEDTWETEDTKTMKGRATLYRPDLSPERPPKRGIDISYSAQLGLPGSEASTLPAVVLRNLIAAQDVEALLLHVKQAAVELGSVSRDSRNHVLQGSWTTHYLHTEGWFQKQFPALCKQMTNEILAVDRNHWGLLEKAPCKTRLGNPVPRTIELHTVQAGGGLTDANHFDSGSLWTLDVMLASPGTDFDGGHLQTFEAIGSLKTHVLCCGDAVAFPSHKRHCVTPVTAGLRQVLVLEFWHGEERLCAHRCTTRWGPCAYNVARSHEDRTSLSTRTAANLSHDVFFGIPSISSCERRDIMLEPILLNHTDVD